VANLDNLDATDRAALGSAEIPNPNKKPEPKTVKHQGNLVAEVSTAHITNPMLHRTSTIKCEATSSPDGPGDHGKGATHFYTPQGAGEESAIPTCSAHLRERQAHDASNGVTPNIRAIRSRDVGPYKALQAFHKLQIRTHLEAGLHAAGMEGEDALWARKKDTLGAGRPKKGSVSNSSSAKTINVDNVIKSASTTGGHISTPNPGAPDPVANRVNNPEMYDQTGRVYRFDKKTKDVAPGNVKPKVKEVDDSHTFSPTTRKTKGSVVLTSLATRDTTRSKRLSTAVANIAESHGSSEAELAADNKQAKKQRSIEARKSEFVVGRKEHLSESEHDRLRAMSLDDLEKEADKFFN
jgi:hypothetical protein